LAIGFRPPSDEWDADFTYVPLCAPRYLPGDQSLPAFNGKVLLLERGSEAVGEYSAGMAQGQRRDVGVNILAEDAGGEPGQITDQPHGEPTFQASVRRDNHVAVPTDAAQATSTEGEAQLTRLKNQLELRFHKLSQREVELDGLLRARERTVKELEEHLRAALSSSPSETARSRRLNRGWRRPSRKQKSTGGGLER